jgi:cystathionine beta-lyase/cystathionine gamma-synthase
MRNVSLDGFGPGTRILHLDRNMDPGTSVAPAIYQSVTHYCESAEDFVVNSTEPLNDQFYARHGNPTTSRIARVIADLEGAEAALFAGSGMGAIAAAALTVVSAGDHVVAQTGHYIHTTKLVTQYMPRFGISVSQVDQRDVGAFAAAIRPETKLIILETPVNPTMHLTDLEAVADLARPRGIITLCDNTVATPLGTNPIALGVDLVAHSATKYIGGHHDLLAGIVCGPRPLIEKVWDTSTILGAIAAPFNSWLALRGIRTLPLRMARHSQNGQAIAEYLEKHPKISKVNYPGLPSHPQHDLAKRQMKSFGGLLSYEVRGGYEGGRRFIQNLKLPLNAGSLGGVDSLVIHPSEMWGGRLPPEVVKEQGITPGLIRMAAGIEETNDLLSDLTQALEHV